MNKFDIFFACVFGGSLVLFVAWRIYINHEEREQRKAYDALVKRTKETIAENPKRKIKDLGWPTSPLEED